MKRLLLVLTLISFSSLPSAAQSFYVDLDVQAFRPFIHFQLKVGNRRPRYSSYRNSYYKGYMDGVNDAYYLSYRFYDLVRDIRAYEAGYRDGARDQRLYCRLNGYNRLPRRPFAYNDYYTPQLSVRLWLNQLTFTFLKAPQARLPRHWSRRAHRRVRRYRKRFRNHHYLAKVEQKYHHNRKRLRSRAHKTQQKYRRRDTRRGRNSSLRAGRGHKLNRKKAKRRVQNRSNRTSRERHRIKSRSRSGHSSNRTVDHKRRHRSVKSTRAKQHHTRRKSKVKTKRKRHKRHHTRSSRKKKHHARTRRRASSHRTSKHKRSKKRDRKRSRSKSHHSRRGH